MLEDTQDWQHQKTGQVIPLSKWQCHCTKQQIIIWHAQHRYVRTSKYQSARVKSFVPREPAHFLLNSIGVQRFQCVHLQGNWKASNIPRWHAVHQTKMRWNYEPYFCYYSRCLLGYTMSSSQNVNIINKRSSTKLASVVEQCNLNFTNIVDKQYYICTSLQYLERPVTSTGFSSSNNAIFAVDSSRWNRFRAFTTSAFLLGIDNCTVFGNSCIGHSFTANTINLWVFIMRKLIMRDKCAI